MIRIVDGLGGLTGHPQLWFGNVAEPKTTVVEHQRVVLRAFNPVVKY